MDTREVHLRFLIEQSIGILVEMPMDDDTSLLISTGHILLKETPFSEVAVGDWLESFRGVWLREGFLESV